MDEDDPERTTPVGRPTPPLAPPPPAPYSIRVKKLLLVAVPLLLLSTLGLLGYAYYTPYLALKNIHAAAEAGNTAELDRYVDFPAVRASLKDQIKQRIDRKAEQSQNPLAALGSALANAFTTPAVDALVTPDNVARMLRGEGLSQAGGPQIRLDGSGVDMGYDDLHTFVVTTAPSGGFELILERSGWFGWRLVDVRLPETWTLPTFSAPPS